MEKIKTVLIFLLKNISKFIKKKNGIKVIKNKSLTFSNNEINNTDIMIRGNDSCEIKENSFQE